LTGDASPLFVLA